MPNLILIRNQYSDNGALYRVLNYALSGMIIGGYGINPNYAYNQMMMVKLAYGKTGGVQLKHYVLSFTNREFLSLTWKEIEDMCYYICQVFCEYQTVFSIHGNSDHIHVHFVMNTVSYWDGKKYAAGLVKFNEAKNMLREVYPHFKSFLFQSRKYSAGRPFTLEDMDKCELLS